MEVCVPGLCPSVLQVGHSPLGSGFPGKDSGPRVPELPPDSSWSLSATSRNPLAAVWEKVSKKLYVARLRACQAELMLLYFAKERSHKRVSEEGSVSFLGIWRLQSQDDYDVLIDYRHHLAR